MTPIAQILVTLLVGLIGAALVYRQHRTASDKLNLDLFDRRFAIFKALRNYLGTITVEGAPKLKDDVSFSEAIEQAKFLFGDDVNGFLKETSDRGFRLQLNDRSLRASNEEGERKKVSQEILADLEAHRKAYERMYDVFRPYLRFDHIRSSSTRWWRRSTNT